jgi:hypothetical protein
MEVTVQDERTQETGPYSEEDQQILDGQEQQQQQQEEQPDAELIGGKFKTTDDLLQAYKELETKLGERSSGYEPKEEEVSEEAKAETDPEDNPLQQEQESAILESIGGQENFESIQKWARDNLDEGEIEAYNKAVNSGDYYQARNALQSMTFAYQNAMGSEPELIGGKLSANSTDVFRSAQEVEAAMNDSRYLVDPAYTNDVQEKVYRSDVLSPR